MINNSLFSPNLIPHSPLKPTKNLNSLLLSSHHHVVVHLSNKDRDFQLAAVASSIPYPPGPPGPPPSMNLHNLESEFSGHGLTFAGISDSSCVVRMQLDNGSVASVMLPCGLITSYKAPMWHGGTLELLHTSVSEEDHNGNGVVIIKGGMSLAFECECVSECVSEQGGGVSWSPTTWVLHHVTGTPQDFIQVELISINSENKVEIKHTVTLQQDLLSSELLISNSKSSSLRLMGSLLSHLTVSTPEATYALGLEGSNFYNTPPLLSSFSITPPDSTQRTRLGYKKLWGPMEVTEFMSGRGVSNQKKGDADNDDAESKERVTGDAEMEAEETDNYKHLTEKMSRIYTSAPRYMTLIDRGRRNSVVVGRDGFNEVYMLSPGSSHQWYGKYAYICIGQSALLQPIIIHPQGVWRGSQRIHNPNL